MLPHAFAFNRRYLGGADLWKLTHQGSRSGFAHFRSAIDRACIVKIRKYQSQALTGARIICMRCDRCWPRNREHDLKNSDVYTNLDQSLQARKTVDSCPRDAVPSNNNGHCTVHVAKKVHAFRTTQLIIVHTPREGNACRPKHQILGS